jgi:hypothetical protein
MKEHSKMELLMFRKLKADTWSNLKELNRTYRQPQPKNYYSRFERLEPIIFLATLIYVDNEISTDASGKELWLETAMN